MPEQKQDDRPDKPQKPTIGEGTGAGDGSSGGGNASGSADGDTGMTDPKVVSGGNVEDDRKKLFPDEPDLGHRKNTGPNAGR